MSLGVLGIKSQAHNIIYVTTYVLKYVPICKWNSPALRAKNLKTNDNFSSMIDLKAIHYYYPIFAKW